MASKKIRILYATPECVPFANSGGLGEVAGSLPGAVNGKATSRMEVRVIMPLYKKVGPEYREKMKFLGSKTVKLNWREQYMGLYEMKHGNVKYYFIDNEYYFDRDGGLYGFYDDGERYAFFSKAVMEALDLMTDYVPNIIHANDWQSALIPVLQTTVYKKAFLHTVFSIHNVEYQGSFAPDFSAEVVGLPEEYRYILEFNGGVNLMKGAIETCTILNTVSPSYAEELKTPEYAFGMQDMINKNAFKLVGVLNGINTTLYDPMNDPYTAAPFSADDLTGKAACKAALQELCGLPKEDVPLFTLISRLVPPKGLDLVREIMDEMLSTQDMQFVLLGTGAYEYEEYFKGLEQRHPDKCRCMIEFNGALSHKIYAGGDILMVPSKSEPCGLTQMIGCRYADVPLVRKTGGLGDSIKDCMHGEGNGFVFEGFDAMSLYNAMMNAITLYQDKENWTNLAKHALNQDFSWSVSGKVYKQLYKEIVQNN